MTALNSELGRDSEIPNDLRSVLDEKALIRCVYDGIHEVRWPKALLPEGLDEDRTPEAILRTLLVYSYATGIYSARDIEAAALHDETISYLAVHHTPKWSTLRAFRRQNVVSLRRALAVLFRVASSGSKDGSDTTYAGFSTARFDLADTLRFELEADKRLKRAIQADSMALDD